MAEKTFDELLSGAQTIRDNELPESNTHTLVGEQLVNMVEKNKEESGKKLAISDLASGRGESTTTAMTQAAVTQELVAQDEKLTELSSLNNIYNVSKLHPLELGQFYTPNTARQIIPLGKRKMGMIITYMTEANVWVIEQYLAQLSTNIGDEFFLNDDLWVKITNDNDIKQNTELINKKNNIYNVTYIHPLEQGEFYTKDTARKVIPLTERKIGMILCYMTSANVWTIEQYLAQSPNNISDDFFLRDDLWSTIINDKNISDYGLMQKIVGSGLRKTIFDVPIYYDSWADNYEGWYIIQTGLKVNSGIVLGTITLRLFSIYSTAYEGTEALADIITVGIYSLNGTLQSNAANTTGNYSGKVKVGYNSEGNLAVFLGGDAYKWRSVNISIDKISVHSTGSIVYNNTGNVDKLSDISNYQKVVDCGLITKSQVLAEIDKKINLRELTINLAKKDANRIAIKKVYEHIRQYTTTQPEDYTPLKVLFTGSSFTNLQWDLTHSPTVDMNGKPLGFQNPDHWTSAMWRLLNPNSLNSEGKVTNPNGNMGFIKVGGEGCTIVGDYQFNRKVDGEWILGDCGGYSGNGEHQFAFFKQYDDFVEFSVPAEAIGYSIIMEKFSGTRSDGINTLPASSQVNIYEDGVLKETVSLVGTNISENHRFDFKKEKTSQNVVVKVMNKGRDSWMAVWGCEYWTGCCIRPINSAISGGSVETLIANKNGCIGELLPDVIIWQPTLSNDGALTSRTYTLYKEYLDYLLSITPTVVAVLQTASISIASNDTTFEQFQRRKNVVRMLCAERGIPIVDIDAYLREKYGKIMPTSVMPDAIHLSNSAEIDISQVFLAAFL